MNPADDRFLKAALAEDGMPISAGPALPSAPSEAEREEFESALADAQRRFLAAALAEDGMPITAGYFPADGKPLPPDRVPPPTLQPPLGLAVPIHLSLGELCTALHRMLEMRDWYAGARAKRVSAYAVLLGEKLGLPPSRLELLRLGCLLHDIGKIGIDDSILRKPGLLTLEEFVVLQRHTLIGAEILEMMIPGVQPIISIARNHHERWDGTGYPDRLVGVNIPYLARIAAVADSFDVMTSHRPYRSAGDKKGRPLSSAFAEVEKQASRQFDPQLSAAFLVIREQVARLFELMRETSADSDLASRPAYEDADTFPETPGTQEPESDFDRLMQCA